MAKDDNTMETHGSSYEEIRRKRVEENRKRLEELNILKLSKALTQPSPAKQSKPKLARKPVNLLPIRRSIRMSDKPQPNYKEGLVKPLETPTRRNSKRLGLLDRTYADKKSRVYAFERAEQLESELGSEFPAFVKPMFHSHVARGFWLGLPNNFCKSYLPKEDEMIELEDEEGNKTSSKFLADRTGLSGGWRGFALDHHLVDGDCLVFQLVKPTKFKVYIIRASEYKTKSEDDEDTEPDDVMEDKDSEPEDILEDSEPEIYEIAVREPSPGKRRSSRKRSIKKLL